MCALDRKRGTVGFQFHAKWLQSKPLAAQSSASRCLRLDKIVFNQLTYRFTTRVIQMAEIRQLDRVQPLGRVRRRRCRACGRAPADAALRLFRSLNIWFWAIVGLPTLVAGVYYFAIASDLYLSEAKFIVRSPKQVQTSGIGALLQSTGSGPSSGRHRRRPRLYHVARCGSQARAEQMICGRFSAGRKGDFVTRFPGILFWRKDFEALFSRYDHFVSVETDTRPG